MKLSQIFSWLLFRRAAKKRRGCRQRVRGCFSYLFLGLLILIALLLAARMVNAQEEEPPERGLAVYLVIDQSNSMFDLSGIGSDPELLRLQAAELFLTYLGVDQTDHNHAAGVIYFGERVEEILPLTQLGQEESRRKAVEQLAAPEPMRWTDQASALERALALWQENELSKQGDLRPVFVLLTDGKPQWEGEAEERDYVNRLRLIQTQLKEEGVTLIFIHLANGATDTDRDIQDLWVPLWQSLSEETHQGEFYQARGAGDLLPIYHDIVVKLTNKVTTAHVVDQTVTAEGTQHAFEMTSAHHQTTLFVQKSGSNLQTELVTPQGTFVDDSQKIVTDTGEMWIFQDPEPGIWTLLVEGDGVFTAWQDVEFHPVPSAVGPSPSPQPTKTLASTPTVEPTSTSRPTAIPTLGPTVEPVLVPAAEGEGRPIRLQETNEAPKTGWRLPMWLFAIPILPFAILFVWQLGFRSRGPWLDGRIVVEQGDLSTGMEREIALEQYRKRSLVIFGPDGLIPDQPDGAELTIAAVKRGLKRTVEVHGRNVLRNGLPILQIPQRAADQDLFEAGDWALRYDNYRLTTSEDQLT